MSRILVTGGAGLLGSHLCERLLKDDHEVVCVDNFYSSSKKNIADLFNNKRFELIRHDITFPLYIEVDEIYNLACPASPIHYQRDPVQTVKTSVHGSINMLGLAKRTGAKILLASTSEVYGDPIVHPQPESYLGNVNTVGDRSCYSDDTEILTESGWKLFSDLNYKDKIATLNDNILEYHYPIEIIKQPYNGEMYNFKSSKYDLYITPNHNLYLISRYGKKYFTTADSKLNYGKNSIVTSIDNIDCTNEIKEMKIGDYTFNGDDWLKFFGYYIADGCACVTNGGYSLCKLNNKFYHKTNYRTIITHGHNPRKFKEYSGIINKLGLTGNFRKHQINIGLKDLTLYLKQFGKARNKFIPNELLNLSQRQTKILFDSMMFGDGTVTLAKNRIVPRMVYNTGSKKLADQFQILAIKCGYSANINSNLRIGSGFSGSKGTYKVNIRYGKRSILIKPQINKYDGYVYCVNVPNHVIMVRRNNKTAFCGNCYDEGKRCAETLFYSYRKQHGLDTKIVRIFNAYGPNMNVDDGRVISNFIVQALQNKPITVYGNGTQTRSFQYVDDMIEGFIKMMNSKEHGPINIGNPGEFTVIELANKIIKLTNSNSKIIHMDLPADDPKQRRPDISLAKKLLNWEPKVNLEDGLIKTIEYFRKNI